MAVLPKVIYKFSAVSTELEFYVLYVYFIVHWGTS